MKINKLYKHLWVVTAISFLAASAVRAGTPQTASDILDHAVNLSGVPQVQSVEANDGITFSENKSAKPKSNDVADSKGSSKSNKNEVIASIKADPSNQKNIR